jgi:uncharacterized membrane protein
VKTLRAAFLTGFLILVPLLATVQLLFWFIHTVDSNVRSFFPSGILPDFGGLGLILALTLIFFTGLFAQNYVGKFIVHLFDSAIRRVSVIGGIYGSIKKFLETILNPQDDQFQETVLVEFPREGIYSIGFRTGHPDPKIARATNLTLVNVFVPCTPNPTSGFYLLVPEEKLIRLDLSVQEAFKIVISLGIVTSEEEPLKTIK